MRRGELAIFARDRATDRLAEAAWSNVGEDASRSIVGHDGVIANAFEQTATNARVQRCDESEPESRQARAEQWYAKHRAVQPPLAGIFAQQVAVRRAIGATDLDRHAPAERDVDGSDEVRDDILDRDRLRLSLHPPRRDHDWQTLDECPNHLERQTSRTENDRRAKLERLNTALAEDLPTA